MRADVGSLSNSEQVSAVDPIAAMFVRYTHHQSIIVKDLSPLMLRLPTLKWSLRRIRWGGAAVSSTGNGRSLKTKITITSSPSAP